MAHKGEDAERGERVKIEGGKGPGGVPEGPVDVSKPGDACVPPAGVLRELPEPLELGSQSPE